MKKLLLLVLILMFTLVGCSKSDHGLDPEHPVTITIWHYYSSSQKNAFDALIDEFNETIGIQKGIIIEGHNQGNVEGLETNVRASMNHEVGSQAMPNIFQTYADNAYVVESAGMLVDLDQYITKEEQSLYIDSYINEGRIGKNNELVIFPIAKSSEVFMLNKTDWMKFSEATGITEADLTTKESLVHIAERYYNWTDSLTPLISGDGKAFYGRDALANLFIIGSKQLGCELFEVNNGKVKLNLNPDIIHRIWDVYYIPTIKGYFASYGRFRSDDAKIGKLIALTGSTSSASYFPTEVTTESGELYPIEAIVLPEPIFEDGEAFAVQQGAGMAVVKSTPAQEYACALFLEWFTMAERNLKFSYDSGYLPVLKAANNFDMVMRVGGEMSQVKQDALKVSFDLVSNRTLYTNKAFEHGGDARKILEYHLHDKALADLEDIQKKISSGMSREEAIAIYDTEANFKNWFAEFSAKLNAVVK